MGGPALLLQKGARRGESKAGAAVAASYGSRMPSVATGSTVLNR